MFYAIVVDDTVELGVLERNMALVLKPALTDLQWYMFEVWL